MPNNRDFDTAAEQLMNFQQTAGEVLDRAPLMHHHGAGTNYCPACKWEHRARNELRDAAEDVLKPFLATTEPEAEEEG